MGQQDEARDRYRSLVDDNVDNVALHGTRGAVAAELRDRDEAMEQFEWLGQVDDAQGRADADLWRGYIAAALGERDLAVKLIRLLFDEGC